MANENKTDNNNTSANETGNDIDPPNECVYIAVEVLKSTKKAELQHEL